MRPLTAACMLSLLVTALPTPAATDHAKAVDAGLRAGRPYVAGEMLVKFKASSSDSNRAQTLKRMSAVTRQNLGPLALRSGATPDLMVVAVPTTQDLARQVAAMRAQGTVEYAEPNWIVTNQTVAYSNDPYLGYLWGLQGADTTPANTFGTGVLSAWANGTKCARNVYVGIVDEGVMIAHPDLKANIWVNPGEGTAINKKDNDKNGFIDDTNGWDFLQRNRTVYDGPADDHGTHIAGTIAAVAGNKVGLIGMCSQARLITAKFMGASGGTLANAVSAINYLTAVKTSKKLRVVASNNSWGGAGFSQALYDAISKANDANILFIAAAGNSAVNIDDVPSYPASYDLPNVITVAAIDANGALASFSNYGESSVHIAAPGVNILSTVPNARNAAAYAYYSGTSMAAPHVAGAAALYASLNPCATAAQIRDAILNHAQYDARLSGYVENSRRLDVSQFSADLNCSG